MRVLIAMGLVLVTGQAFAQPEERNNPASTALRPEGGGPSSVGDPVRVSNLSVTHTDTDLVVKTALGDFALTRTYTGSPETWNLVWDGPLWFGKGYYHRDWDYGSGKPPVAHWWSSLTGYAVETLKAGTPEIDPTLTIRIRDMSGDLVSAGELFDVSGLVFRGTGGTRIKRSSVSAPGTYTLIRPGVGQFVYSYYSTDESGPYTNRRFRLTAIYPDLRGAPPLATLSYSGWRVQWVTLSDGTRLHVIWDGGGLVSQVELWPNGSTEGTVVVTYGYDSLRLSYVAYPETGESVSYAYRDGTAGIFGVTRGAGSNSEVLFTKSVSGPGVAEYIYNWGWEYGPANVSSESAQNGSMLYTVNANGLDAGDPNNYSKAARDFQAPSTTGTLTQKFTTSASEGLTSGVELTCRYASGSACTETIDATADWSIVYDAPEPYAAVVKDYRGNYTRLDAGELTWPPGCEVNECLEDTEVWATRKGATASDGTGALSTTTYTWQYATADNAHEKLPATVEVASVVQQGQKAIDSFRYDLATKRLLAQFRTGYTKVLGPSSVTTVQKTVATFYFNTYACEGVVTPDEMNRTVEVHGPCFVANTAATDCDPALNANIPITQYRYYPTTEPNSNAGRLSRITTFPGTTTTNCVGAQTLNTDFLAYDARGHVQLETDPNSVMTFRFYQGDRLRMEWKHGAVTRYFYNPAQGGQVSSKRLPSGAWEMYCYRVDANEECEGGVLTSNLQWRGRVASVELSSEPTSPITFLDKTVFTYDAPGAQSGGGLLVEEASSKTGEATARRVVRHGYDPMGRENSTGAGASAFSTPSLYDENGNKLAVGAPYNSPPPSCGGRLAPVGQCTSFGYDQLDRVAQVTTFAQPPWGAVGTAFLYDDQSNVKTVTQTPGGTVVTYDHDDFGNVIEVTGQWMGGSVKQEFDARGNLLKRRTPVLTSAGTNVTYAWDATNRPLSAQAADGTYLWRYGYDYQTLSEPTNCPDPRNVYGLGRVQWKDDSLGRTWYEYDQLGNVVRLRRVRAGEFGACSTTETSSSNDTPDTEYTYTTDGRLTEMKYPHGRRIKYTWGSTGSGREGEVVAIQALVAGNWEALLSNIRYDVDGTVEAYDLGTPQAPPRSVEWLRRGAGSSPPSSCNDARPTSVDGTGRLSMVLVSRQALSAPESSRTGDVYKLFYAWQADQLVSETGCMLGEAAGRTLAYNYDGTLQVTGGSRPGCGPNCSDQGPWYARSYAYVNGSDRDFVQEDDDGFKASYDGQRRMTAYSPRPPSCPTCADSSWRARYYSWDVDGRMTQLRDTQMPKAGRGTAWGKLLDLTPSDSYGAVYRAVRASGATYEYYFDAQGRRRAKLYPIVGLMDEFFYDGDKLIEDRGNTQKYYSGSGDKYSVDEYVWLAGMPVAVLKSTFRDDWSRNPSDTYAAGCLRNDEAEACGKFFIINDGLPKPVAMLDGDGRLVGAGEYDVFGRVNTVTRIADSPAQPGFDGWPFGNYLANQNMHLMMSMYETPRGTGHQVQARVNYAAIHTSGATDYAWVRSRAGGQVLAPAVYGSLIGAKDTAWFQVPFNDYVDVRWQSDSVQETSMYPYNGVVVAGWEYRHYEAGAAPRWTPLRFPGQYADAESGLFENWNRFYEPATGRYTAGDVSLWNAALVLSDYAAGTPQGAYTYVRNQPLGLIDPTGMHEPIGDSVPLSEAVSMLGSSCENPKLCEVQKEVLLTGAALYVPVPARLAIAAVLLDPSEAGAGSGTPAPTPPEISAPEISTQVVGAELARQNGANRVTIQTEKTQLRIDLAGDSHYDKPTRTIIPTPQVLTNEKLVKDGKTIVSGKSQMRAATFKDLRIVRNILRRRP